MESLLLHLARKTDMCRRLWNYKIGNKVVRDRQNFSYSPHLQFKFQPQTCHENQDLSLRTMVENAFLKISNLGIRRANSSYFCSDTHELSGGSNTL